MVYCAGRLIETFKLFYKSVSQSAQAHVTSLIGPLQVAIHVVRNRRTGEQKSHWDKTNKRHT